MNAVRPFSTAEIGSYGPAPRAADDPTNETYSDLNRAFQVFNQRLFDGKLHNSLITLRARGRTNGYFSPDRFVHADGRRSHEIALNPEMFACYTIERSLSTLAHEQVHQLQYQEQTASRRGYHNADWARRMEEIGLMPSTTGRPGGAKTGEKVTHYLIPRGRFLEVVRDLLDDRFRARWADRFVTMPREEWVGEEGEPGENPEGDPAAAQAHHGVSVAIWVPEPRGPEAGEPESGHATPNQDPFGNPLTHASTTPAASPTPGAAPVAQPGGEPASAALIPQAFVFGRNARQDSSKTKFVCPVCRSAAWGKPSLNLLCGNCDAPMPPVQAIPVASAAGPEDPEDP